jgi:hypothetical protein
VLLTAEYEEGGEVVGLDQRKVARVVCEQSASRLLQEHQHHSPCTM